MREILPYQIFFYQIQRRKYKLLIGMIVKNIVEITTMTEREEEEHIWKLKKHRGDQNEETTPLPLPLLEST